MFDGQYLDFNTYKQLGGTLENTPFKLLEYNARKKIDERTFGRLIGLTTIPNEVKLCVFELIKSLSSYEDIVKNGNISSENIDGYSITYTKLDKATIEARNSASDNIINTYLSNTLIDNIPVLYRGAK